MQEVLVSDEGWVKYIENEPDALKTIPQHSRSWVTSNELSKGWVMSGK